MSLRPQESCIPTIGVLWVSAAATETGVRRRCAADSKRAGELLPIEAGVSRPKAVGYPPSLELLQALSVNGRIGATAPVPASRAEWPLPVRQETFAGTQGNGRDAPEAAIFEPQNLRQSAVALHLGG